MKIAVVNITVPIKFQTQNPPQHNTLSWPLTQLAREREKYSYDRGWNKRDRFCLSV